MRHDMFSSILGRAKDGFRSGVAENDTVRGGGSSPTLSEAIRRLARLG
jgi:hypothetical protein